MEEAFAESTVEDLVYNMKEIGCGHNSARIEILGLQWYTMTELLHKPVRRAPARHIVIRFYGGPPGAQGVYDGTLLTMLMDRLLQNAADHRSPMLLDEVNEQGH
jgi:hypothetical protein